MERERKRSSNVRYTSQLVNLNGKNSKIARFRVWQFPECFVSKLFQYIIRTEHEIEYAFNLTTLSSSASSRSAIVDLNN